MTEWNIQSRAHACSSCGNAFADQQAYHTLLFDEKADLRRSDICQACWQKQYSEGARDRKGFISYWQGVYEAPAPPVEVIQRENAESLQRKLIELNDPRFMPVQEDELDDLDISVDVLSAPEPIESLKELDPKRYGVIVVNGWRRGLLLPNLEGVDTVEDQIAIALRKAGISKDENYQLERFEVVRHE